MKVRCGGAGIRQSIKLRQSNNVFGIGSRRCRLSDYERPTLKISSGRCDVSAEYRLATVFVKNFRRKTSGGVKKYLDRSGAFRPVGPPANLGNVSHFPNIRRVSFAPLTSVSRGRSTVPHPGAGRKTETERSTALKRLIQLVLGPAGFPIRQQIIHSPQKR